MNKTKRSSLPPIPESEDESYESQMRFYVNYCMDLGMNNMEAEIFLDERYDISPIWTRHVWEKMVQETRAGHEKRRRSGTAADGSPSPTPTHPQPRLRPRL